MTIIKVEHGTVDGIDEGRASDGQAIVREPRAGGTASPGEARGVARGLAAPRLGTRSRNTNEVVNGARGLLQGVRRDVPGLRNELRKVGKFAHEALSVVCVGILSVLTLTSIKPI
jgi:hypothetical protein